MQTEASDVERNEALYDWLAEAIDAVREGRSDDHARDCEAQFLTKVSFLALRAVKDEKMQRDIIALAALHLE
jgi:hypothetical protein